MDLFKGYILTLDKKAIEKFKNRTDLKTYEQVKNLDEFAGILAEDIILIDIDDIDESEILYKIITDNKVKCKVYKTTRGKHFLFKNKEVETCKTHTKLAIGITADIKLGCRNSYSILKFKGVEREVLYDTEEYEELPKWLLPIKNNVDFIGMATGDGRNQALFNYILTLQSNGFTQQEAIETIKLINDYVFKEKLNDNEINIILRNDSFKKESFYNGNVFLFDKFAMFLISKYNIIKINNNLHVFDNGVYILGYDILESKMIKHIPGLNKQKRMEVLAYINIAIEENTPISPANYIAFKNGIYDLDNDQLINYDPSIIITNKINYNYNKNSGSEILDKALNRLSCDDLEIRKLLEEVVGYCFYRRNELRKSFILIGDKANGKSTFLDMIKTILGDSNTSALDLSELGMRFKAAELFGKLANIGDDIGDEFIPNPAIFKKLVSGDRINVERKGRDPFDFNNYSKLLFSANSIPRIKDKSGAVIDRLIIVPFDATFTVNDPDFDPYIKYKLRANEVLEHLIKLGLDGLKRVLSNQKFTTNIKVQQEIEEYEENNNPVITFIKEVGVEEIINEPTKNVYRKYNEFCLANNFTPLSNIEFIRKINKQLNLEVKRIQLKGENYKMFTEK